MHWHLWRIRRRQRPLLEDGLLLDTPLTPKKVIDPTSLALFPTRIIGDEQVQKADSHTSRAIENVESSTSHQQNNNHLEDTCVICLDEFGLGDQVRKLPCGHEYHCECIGSYQLKTKLFFFL